MAHFRQQHLGCVLNARVEDYRGSLGIASVVPYLLHATNTSLEAPAQLSMSSYISHYLASRDLLQIL